LGGYSTEAGTPAYTERGIYYGTTANPAAGSATKVQIAGNGTGVYSQEVSGLTANTTYHVRAYAVQQGVTVYGGDSTFTTLLTPLSLNTLAAENITATTATLGGKLLETDGVTERGVCWATTANPTISGSHQAVAGLDLDNYPANVTGLTPYTTYYVRAYATNSGGTKYGEERNFTTLDIPVTVTTTAATAVTITTATLGATISAEGTPAHTEFGVCYGTSPNPTTADNKTPITVGSTVSVSNLTLGTTYHVRAYAINAVGTVYGGDSTFTTLSDAVTDIPTELYLFGTGSLGADETEGRAFREAEAGVFHIYTNLTNGSITFGSDADVAQGYKYYAHAGNLHQGSNATTVAATTDNPVRLIVDFNNSTVTTHVISDVSIGWTQDDGESSLGFHDQGFVYQGGGNFKTADVKQAPFSTVWGNVIGVYRFKVKIDGAEYVWGSDILDPNTSIGNHPVPGVSPAAYYQINEYPNPVPGAAESEWAARYRMAEAYQNKQFDVTIFTNKNDMIVHEFSNVRERDSVVHTPATLYLFGTGAAAANETEGRAFRETEPGVFHIYTKLATGRIKFSSSATLGAEYTYYSSNGLREGNDSTPVTATANNNPVRIIVDFNTKTVTREVISDLNISWTQDDGTGNIEYPDKVFVYQGEGVFKASGVSVGDFYTVWGNVIGVYRLKLKIDGTDYVWGSDMLSPDVVENQRHPIHGSEPVGYYQINEYPNSVGTWDYRWRMAESYQNDMLDVYIYTNRNGMIYHEFTEYVSNVEHTPATLYLFGAGALGTDETEGRAFRQVSPGVFQIYTNLAAGNIKFSSSPTFGAEYVYYDDHGLIEGNDSTPVAATTGNPVRLTVDFNTLTVTKEVISDLIITYLDGNGGDPAYHNGTFVYQGGGDFKLENVVYGNFNTQYPNTIGIYQFSLQIDGVNYVWGSDMADSQTAMDTRPTHGVTSATYYQIVEHFGSSFWEYWWGIATACENKTFDITIHTNSGDMMYHEFTNIH
jgi:hypothetical protein